MTILEVSHYVRASRVGHTVWKGHFMELQQGALAVAEGQRRAFLNEVVGK